MKKRVMTVMALLFVAAIATSAAAANFGRGPGYDRGRAYGPCASESFRGISQLNLTAEQTAKLAEVRNERTKELIPLQEQLFSKRNLLRKLWLEATPDQEKIIAAQKELNSLRDQMQEKTVTYRLKSLQVLTPAQQEIAKASMYSGTQGARGRKGIADGKGRGQFSFSPACLR